jgi:hypothetical protein
VVQSVLEKWDKGRLNGYENEFVECLRRMNGYENEFVASISHGTISGLV